MSPINEGKFPDIKLRASSFLLINCVKTVISICFFQEYSRVISVLQQTLSFKLGIKLNCYYSSTVTLSFPVRLIYLIVDDRERYDNEYCFN